MGEIGAREARTAHVFVSKRPNGSWEIDIQTEAAAVVISGHQIDLGGNRLADEAMQSAAVSALQHTSHDVALPLNSPHNDRLVGVATAL